MLKVTSTKGLFFAMIAMPLMANEWNFLFEEKVLFLFWDI